MSIRDVFGMVGILLSSFAAFMWGREVGIRYGLARARDILAAKVAKRIELDKTHYIGGEAMSYDEYHLRMRQFFMDADRREIQKGLS